MADTSSPSHDDPPTESELRKLKQRLDVLEPIVLELFGYLLGSPIDENKAISHMVTLGDVAIPMLLRRIRPVPSKGLDSWDQHQARRLAIEALGSLKARDAVQPLIDGFLVSEPGNDIEHLLCERAIWALGEIGDPKAIPPLIPLLGDYANKWGGPLYGHAAEALRKLGEGDLVDAFGRVMTGEAEGIEKLKGYRRDEVVDAFINSLETPTSIVVHAACALAALGAVRALPVLKSKNSIFVFRSEHLKQQWQQAIDTLEAQGELPRAVTAENDVETLPRPTDESSANSRELPRSLPIDVDIDIGASKEDKQ